LFLGTAIAGRLDRVAEALRALLPTVAVILLESSSIDHEVEQGVHDHIVPATLVIRPGISWPRSQMLHVMVTPEALGVLGDLITGLPAPQICSHMYAYSSGDLLLEWTDVFDDPIFVAGSMPEATVAKFCDILGVTPVKGPGAV